MFTRREADLKRIRVEREAKFGPRRVPHQRPPKKKDEVFAEAFTSIDADLADLGAKGIGKGKGLEGGTTIVSISE